MPKTFDWTVPETGKIGSRDYVVKAFDCGPLVVHHNLKDVDRGALRPKWNVAHKATGMTVRVTSIPNARVARILAYALLALDIPWNAQTQEEFGKGYDPNGADAKAMRGIWELAYQLAN